MSIFEYIPLMKEMGGITGYAGAIIVALFLLIVICRMISGMRQGFWRQLVNSARHLSLRHLSEVDLVQL